MAKPINVKNGDLIEVNGVRARVRASSKRYELHYVEIKGKQRERVLEVSPLGHQKVKLIRQNPAGRDLPITYFQPEPKKTKRALAAEPIPNKFRVRMIHLNGDTKLTHDYRPVMEDDDALNLAMWLLFYDTSHDWVDIKKLLVKMERHYNEVTDEIMESYR